MKTKKSSGAFSDILAECANEFVHFAANEANNLVLKRGKSKILLEDIYLIFEQLGFTNEDIEAIKIAVKSFEENEKNKKDKKQRFSDKVMQPLSKKQDEMLANTAMKMIKLTDNEIETDHKNKTSQNEIDEKQDFDDF